MESEKKSMKGITITLLGMFILSVVIGGILLNRNNIVIEELNAKNYVLEMDVEERDSLVNEFIAAYDTIENSLTFINEKRSELVLADKEMTISRQETLVNDIKLMNTMLEESSARISALEKKLKKSGIQIRALKSKIAGLNKKIEQQNTLISDIASRFKKQSEHLAVVNYEKDSLKNEVLSFRDSLLVKNNILLQKDALISRHIGELNKGFFAYGTSKELSENGVIAKKGGFLGIGKSKVVGNDINQKYFTEIDITEQRIIELNAKKVKLISEHPSQSYRLIEEEGLVTRLEIETPVDFWKISQYAVIEVKL